MLSLLKAFESSWTWIPTSYANIMNGRMSEILAFVLRESPDYTPGGHATDLYGRIEKVPKRGYICQPLNHVKVTLTHGLISY